GGACSSTDPSAAEDAVAVVEYDRLPGRDAELRLVERYPEPVVADKLDFGRGPLVPIADFRLALETTGNAFDQPVETIGFELGAGQIFAGADHDLPAIGPHGENIPRSTERRPQPAALANGEVLVPLVPAHDIA